LLLINSIPLEYFFLSLPFTLTFAYSPEPSCTRVQPDDIPTIIYWLVQAWSTYRSDLLRFCSWWISNRAFFDIFARTVARFLRSYWLFLAHTSLNSSSCPTMCGLELT